LGDLSICNFDFLKIDAEGQEAKILRRTSRSDWLNTYAMIEVGNSQNAEMIYEFFKLQRKNLFSQKDCWAKVETLSDIPTSYRDGSLFISNKILVP